MKFSTLAITYVIKAYKVKPKQPLFILSTPNKNDLFKTQVSYKWNASNVIKKDTIIKCKPNIELTQLTIDR